MRLQDSTAGNTIIYEPYDPQAGPCNKFCMAFNRYCASLLDAPYLGNVLFFTSLLVIGLFRCCYGCCNNTLGVLFRKIRFAYNPPYEYKKNYYPTFRGFTYDFYNKHLKIPFNNEYIDIDNVLIYLRENRLQLEKPNSYMHWLFPIDESFATLLEKNPKSAFWFCQEHDMQRSINDAQSNFFQAFQIMLDFWGMAFSIDHIPISIQKTPEWTERLDYILTHPESYLHIARVIRSLIHFNMHEYQEPLLNFLMHEVLITRSMASAEKVLTSHWIAALTPQSRRNRVLNTYAAIIQEAEELHLRPLDTPSNS